MLLLETVDKKAAARVIRRMHEALGKVLQEIETNQVLSSEDLELLHQIHRESHTALTMMGLDFERERQEQMIRDHPEKFQELLRWRQRDAELREKLSRSLKELEEVPVKKSRRRKVRHT